MNSFHGIGRLVRDVDFKTTQSGLAVSRFTIAIDRRAKQDEEKKADFIPCTAFGKTAEFVNKYFSKGKKIVVMGRVQTGSYDNKDGVKIYTTDIMVDEVEFAESKQSESNQNAPADPGYAVSADDDTSLPFDL